SAGAERIFLLARERVFQIAAQPLELRLISSQGIRLARIEHVPHGERNAVKAVLDAQQQQRIGAVAVDDFRLDAPQAAELNDGVARIHADRKKSQDETRDQSRRRGTAVQSPGIPVERSAFNSAFLLLLLAPGTDNLP